MRVEGWEGLLDEHIHQAGVFAWGMNDCALWSADWVRKATGQDFASKWRRRYTSEDELMALLHAMGIERTEEIADDALPRVEVAFAQRGDIVQHPLGFLGICNGLHSHFLTDRGTTIIKTKSCPRAWVVR